LIGHGGKRETEFGGDRRERRKRRTEAGNELVTGHGVPEEVTAKNAWTQRIGFFVLFAFSAVKGFCRIRKEELGAL
jgi:hypothetical protein